MQGLWGRKSLLLLLLLFHNNKLKSLFLVVSKTSHRLFQYGDRIRSHDHAGHVTEDGAFGRDVDASVVVEALVSCP